VNDVYLVCAVLFLALIPILWLAKPPFGNADGAVGH
jgi:DHA2 family multidrug resistance protein